MRILSTLFLLLISTACFSQVEDLIRKAEYGIQKSGLTDQKISLCNMKGSLSYKPELPTFPKPQLKTDSSTLPLFMRSHISVLRDGQLTVVDRFPKKDSTRIVIRCGGSYSSSFNPLFVVDGVPYELKDNKLVNFSGRDSYKEFNPDDIESIYILKEDKATSIYGCRGTRGVIIITTKSNRNRTFIIKDFLDGSKIARATVSFYRTDKKDSIILAANDSGIVVTDKLATDVNYEMKVTAVGYQSFTQVFKNRSFAKEQFIQLSRDVKMGEDVIISVIEDRRRIHCGIFISHIITRQAADDKVTLSSVKTFPNPLQRGTAVNTDFTAANEEKITINIVGLDGKLLLSKAQTVYKGINRISVNTDPRWAAGIYILQLYANGKLLASDKLIIQ